MAMFFNFWVPTIMLFFAGVYFAVLLSKLHTALDIYIKEHQK
jgi:hypothetical protein